MLIAYKYSDYLFGDTVPYIKWWPAMINAPIPAGGDTASYQTKILQLGSVEATSITLDGTSGNLTAGRIVSRVDGSYGNVRFVPTGDTGQSAVGFFRNGGGTSDVPGDFWGVGQGVWTAGDRALELGATQQDYVSTSTM